MSSRFATPLSLRSSLLLATTLVALFVLPACPGNGGEAKASRGMELALQDDAVFVNPTYFDRERAFKHLRSLGVTRLRVSLGWANAMPQSQAKKKTKPAKIEWYFGLYDNLIDAAADQGIRVQLTSADRRPPGRPATTRRGRYGRARASSASSPSLPPSTSPVASTATASGTSRTGSRGSTLRAATSTGRST